MKHIAAGSERVLVVGSLCFGHGRSGWHVHYYCHLSEFDPMNPVTEKPLGLITPRDI